MYGNIASGKIWAIASTVSALNQLQVNLIAHDATSPAMAAVVNVAKIPLPRAENATREMLCARGGARRESKPTWMPTDDRLPKPQSAYVAMSLAVWSAQAIKRMHMEWSGPMAFSKRTGNEEIDLRIGGHFVDSYMPQTHC